MPPGITEIVQAKKSTLQSDLKEACLIASGTGDLAYKLIQIILIAATFCCKIVQLKTMVCLAGRPTRCDLICSMLPMLGCCKQLAQDKLIQTYSVMLSITMHGSIIETRCHFPGAAL